jgi:hypothetical protein
MCGQIWTVIALSPLTLYHYEIRASNVNHETHKTNI